jgi:hypothetical protein
MATATPARRAGGRPPRTGPAARRHRWSPALLAGLARAIHEQGHQIHSAHIATYGERAVDVFYLTNSENRKLDRDQIEGLREALLESAREVEEAKAEAAQLTEIAASDEAAALELPEAFLPGATMLRIADATLTGEIKLKEGDGSYQEVYYGIGQEGLP